MTDSSRTYRNGKNLQAVALTGSVFLMLIIISLIMDDFGSGPVKHFSTGKTKSFETFCFRAVASHEWKETNFGEDRI